MTDAGDSPKPYTYICEHGESGVPSPFIATLLQQGLIRPAPDQQLLIHCPTCTKGHCQSNKKGIIEAAIAVASSDTTRDTMTILVALANLWCDFRSKPSRKTAELLQIVCDALSKAYNDSDPSYYQVVDCISKDCDSLLAIEIMNSQYWAQLDGKNPIAAKAIQQLFQQCLESNNELLIVFIQKTNMSDLTELLIIASRRFLQDCMKFVTFILRYMRESKVYLDQAKTMSSKYPNIAGNESIIRGNIWCLNDLAMSLKISLYQISWGFPFAPSGRSGSQVNNVFNNLLVEQSRTIMNDTRLLYRAVLSLESWAFKITI
jgi:hypothetical protein